MADTKDLPESNEEQPNVSPEEQAQYDRVIIEAQGLMYTENGIKTIVQKLTSMKDRLPLAIGHTAAMLIKSVSGGLKKAGQPVEGDVLFAAGQEIVADLIEIAQAAKLVPEGEDPEVLMQQSLFEGLKVYGDTEMAGGVDPKAQAEARAQLDQPDVAKVAAAMKAGLPPGAKAREPGIVESQTGA